MTRYSSTKAIGGILFIALLFFAGLWIPRPLMSNVLLDIRNWIPAGACVAVMQNAMQGTALALQPLLLLIGYTMVFGYLSMRLFRWESPRFTMQIGFHVNVRPALAANLLFSLRSRRQ